MRAPRDENVTARDFLRRPRRTASRSRREYDRSDGLAGFQGGVHLGRLLQREARGDVKVQMSALYRALQILSLIHI